MIEYMEKYVDEFHCQNDAVSRFHTSKSAVKVLEDLKQQHTFYKQEERNSDPAWNNLSESAKCCYVEADETQIESEIAQHPVDKSDLNIVKMHLLYHFFDHIRQRGDFITASYELSERTMMVLKQA